MTDRDVDLINVQMMLVNEPTFEGIKPEIGMNVADVQVHHPRPYF